MTNTKRNWQVSFGVTYQLEYGELIQLYDQLPKMQQGAVGRKLMQAGLEALKKEGDPVILKLLSEQQKPAVIIEPQQPAPIASQNAQKVQKLLNA